MKKAITAIVFCICVSLIGFFINDQQSEENDIQFTTQSSGWGWLIPKKNGGISETSPYVMPIYHDFSKKKRIYVRPDLYALTDVAGSVNMNESGRPKSGLPEFYRTRDFLDGDDFSSMGEDDYLQRWNILDNLDISQESNMSYSWGNVWQTDGPSIRGTMPIIIIDYNGGSPNARTATNSGPIRFFGGGATYREDKSCCKNHLGVIFEFRDSNELWNMPPSSQDDFITVQGNDQVVFNILENDLDYEQDSLYIYESNTLQYPDSGISVNKDGTVTYTPKENQCGELTFSYRTIDRDPDILTQRDSIYEGKIGLSPLRGEVTIDHICTVQAQDDTMAVASNEAQIKNIIENDMLHGSESNTVTIIQQPHIGVSSIQDNKILFTPPVSSVASQTSVIYQVCDESNSCSQAVLYIDVAEYGQAQKNTTPEQVARQVPIVETKEEVVAAPQNPLPIQREQNDTVAANQKIVPAKKERTTLQQESNTAAKAQEENTKEQVDTSLVETNKDNHEENKGQKETEIETNKKENTDTEDVKLAQKESGKDTIDEIEADSVVQKEGVQKKEEQKEQDKTTEKENNTNQYDTNTSDISVAEGLCGDGEKSDQETCDDGNLLEGDGCNKECQKELRYCGDGIIQRPNEGGFIEQCDDGNNREDDGCYSCLYTQKGTVEQTDIIEDQTETEKVKVNKNTDTEIRLLGYDKSIMVESANAINLTNKADQPTAMIDSNNNYFMIVEDPLNKPVINQKIVLAETSQNQVSTFKIFNTDYVGVEHASGISASNRLSIVNQGTNIAAQLMLEVDSIDEQEVEKITDAQRERLDAIVEKYEAKYDQNEMMIMLSKIQETRNSTKEISHFTQRMRQYLLTQWVINLSQ